MDSMIEVQGKQLKLSNLDKVLYPAAGFTKQQIIDYYVRICANAMLPHLAGRALTRKRYPNGVDEEVFLRKECAPTPSRLGEDFAPIWSEGNHRTVHYIPGERSADAGVVGQSGGDPNCTRRWLCRRTLLVPTMMVFDLDPGIPCRQILCNAARSDCGFGKFSNILACESFS